MLSALYQAWRLARGATPEEVLLACIFRGQTKLRMRRPSPGVFRIASKWRSTACAGLKILSIHGHEQSPIRIDPADLDRRNDGCRGFGESSGNFRCRSAAAKGGGDLHRVSVPLPRLQLSHQPDGQDSV